MNLLRRSTHLHPYIWKWEMRNYTLGVPFLCTEMWKKSVLRSSSVARQRPQLINGENVFVPGMEG